MSDYFLGFLAIFLAAYITYQIISEVRHRLDCRRRERMDQWQRRALIDGQSRGFQLEAKPRSWL